MRPGNFNLPTIWRGCDWLPVIFQWKDGNGNPIDLSGMKAFVVTANGINLNPGIYDVHQGVVLLSLPRSLTISAPLGDTTWNWIWQVNYPSGIIYPPFLSGTVTVAEPTTENFS